MLKQRIENKAGTAFEATTRRLEETDSEIASLRASAKQVEAKLTEALVSGTDAQRKSLSAARDRIEDAVARLERDRPVIAAAVERARENMKQAQWEDELAEQRKLEEQFQAVARQMEDAAHEVAKHFSEYEALWRENEQLNRRAETMAQRLKREPFPRLVLDDVLGFPSGFLMALGRISRAAKDINLNRRRDADIKNQPPRNYERIGIAFREGIDSMPPGEPPVERSYRYPAA